MLLKTVYEKHFIVIEAKKAMENAATNVAIPETIEVLTEGCKAKNGTLAELSIYYLKIAVGNIN